MEDGGNRDAGPDEMLPLASEANSQAAILLVESLIHGLISKSVISVAEAVEIVETAADVTVEIATEIDGQGAPGKSSFTILSAIANSLKYDIP